MRGYTGFLLAVLAGYGVVSWRGWELGAEKRGHIPQSVRQAPGGYRSFNYWRGGK
jgi:hypothetical protein